MGLTRVRVAVMVAVMVAPAAAVVIGYHLLAGPTFTAGPAGAVPIERATGATAVAPHWRVLFDVDSADLGSAAPPALESAVAAIAEAPPASKVRVEGYTDSIGSYDHNLGLSQARAETVAGWLQVHGVDGSRITVEHYGSNYPVAPNDTEEHRQENRRVIVAIVT